MRAVPGLLRDHAMIRLLFAGFGPDLNILVLLVLFAKLCLEYPKDEMNDRLKPFLAKVQHFNASENASATALTNGRRHLGQ